MSDDVLTIQAMQKSFGGLMVIDDVSFSVRRGSRTALIGPNGAGKTTVFNLLSGVYQVDGGSIDLDGTDTTSYYYDLNDRTRAFSKKFVAGAKKKGIIKPWPHHVDASAYDIVYVFKKAMELAKVTGDPVKVKEERTAIRDALLKTSFDLISGNVCFDKNGDAQLPGYILTMKNKKWILLDTHAPLPCKR